MIQASNSKKKFLKSTIIIVYLIYSSLYLINSGFPLISINLTNFL